MELVSKLECISISLVDGVSHLAGTYSEKGVGMHMHKGVMTCDALYIITYSECRDTESLAEHSLHHEVYYFL